MNDTGSKETKVKVSCEQKNLVIQSERFFFKYGLYIRK